MKLHQGLIRVSSRVFVSPVQPALLPGSPRTDGYQPALLPGSPRTDGFHVFGYRSIAG